MKTPTKAQQRILDYLIEHQRHGVSMPSIQEITEYCGYKSTKATRDHLHVLSRDGWISREPGKARSISVLTEESGSLSLDRIPVLGAIPAGPADARAEYVEGHIGVSLASLGICRTSKIFALKVHGNSMTERGIFDGDTAIIDGAGACSNGSVVAALVDGEVSLKTLVDPGDREKAFLKAENPIHSDIYPVLSLSIQGVVRAIIRTSP